MTINPKLKKDLISEAIVEIRFHPIPDLSLVVGTIHSTLKDIYPKFADLGVPDVPNLPEFNNVIKYRFYSENKKKLYQFGKGILSVNTLEYEGFEKFIDDVGTVIDTFQKISEFALINRVGLRYVNKVETEGKKLNKFLNFEFKLPAIIKDIETGFNYHSIGKKDNNFLMTRYGSAKPSNKDTIILDFDFYNEIQQQYNLKNLIKWIDEGHKIIYETFKTSLTKEYFEFLS